MTLTVAIDPGLDAHRGPIAWVLREMLVALGYSWREVPFGTHAEIVYARVGYDGDARVLIESEGWSGATATSVTDRWVPVDIDVRGRWIVRRDLVRELFRLMTGAAESRWPQDVHGHYDVPAAVRPSLRVAVASRLIDALGRVLTETGWPAGRPRWPDGAAAAACFTHDVDYPEVVRWAEPLRVLRRLGWRAASTALRVATGQYHHWHFRTWMALEEDIGVRSAFFFATAPGSVWEYARGRPDPFYDVRAPQFAEIISALLAQGWEVGLHASYNAWRDPAVLGREKALLESVTGQPVIGVRHHYWRLDPAQPSRTLALHEQQGFLYDASLAHDHFMGFRRGLAWPHRPWDVDGRRPIATLQLPTAWMDEQLFRHWRGSREAADAALDELVTTALEVGGCLVSNVHEYMVDAHLHPGRFQVARSLWQMVSVDPRFWKTTPAGMARHWRERQTACESASVGLAVA